MSSTHPFVTTKKNSEEVIPWTIQMLEKAGMRVIQTFDLQGARLSHPKCPCPHHGTEACDCQISVLLVYQKEQPPASLLIHGFQESTWMYLVDTPEQPINHCLDALIKETLTSSEPMSIDVSDNKINQRNSQ